MEILRKVFVTEWWPEELTINAQMILYYFIWGLTPMDILRFYGMPG